MTRIKRDIPFAWTLVPFLIMIASMTLTVLVFKGEPHIPLLIGAVAAGIVAWLHGYSWAELEDALYDGIRRVLPAVVILMLVGVLIATWAAGGLVGAMTYYGLKFLSPAYFLPSIIVLCVIASLMTGSSWSTIGTVGIAGLAMGVTMGIPEPAIVGAVASGAFFGDKMSPLSDTTVLASAIAETNIFTHIRHMMYTTIPGLVLALVVAFAMSSRYSGVDSPQILEVMNALESSYNVSAWLLLVPLIVPVFALSKVPTLPTLLTAIAAGAACYILFEGGDFNQLVNLAYSGYTSGADNEIVARLLDQGGMNSMMYTVSLAIVAMAFGGLMKNTGMLNTIVALVLKAANTGRKLCAATVVSSFVTNVITAEQYISIIIPGEMYPQAYDDKGLARRNLSRALEDGGTVTSALVPWSTDAVFIYTTMGVTAWAYAPYAVLNWSVPLISIAMSLAGIAVKKRVAPSTLA